MHELFGVLYSHPTFSEKRRLLEKNEQFVNKILQKSDTKNCKSFVKFFDKIFAANFSGIPGKGLCGFNLEIAKYGNSYRI